MHRFYAEPGISKFSTILHTTRKGKYKFMPIVKRYTHVVEAHVAVTTLQGRGIPAELVNEATATLMPRLSGTIGGIGVFVADEHATSARELLEVKVDTAKNIQNVAEVSSVFRKTLRVTLVAFVLSFVVLLFFKPGSEIGIKLAVSAVVGVGIGFYYLLGK